MKGEFSADNRGFSGSEVKDDVNFIQMKRYFIIPLSGFRRCAGRLSCTRRTVSGVSGLGRELCIFIICCHRFILKIKMNLPGASTEDQHIVKKSKYK